MNTRAALRPLDEALAELLGQAGLLAPPETVPTFDADGRVLAEDLVSPLQVPPQDNSSMDGYAVRRAEIPDEGVVLPVSQRIPAGQAARPLLPGTVARIFTGAPVPSGADAIVIQEDTEAAGEGRVRILRVPGAGQWIRRSGEDVKRGAFVLERGRRLDPAACGLAAGIGRAELKVARRPKVALFSTGDELVMPGTVAPEQMRAGAIYNSNRFFLRQLLTRCGCEVSDLGIVPDRRDATVEAIRGAAQSHDLILTSGGVSVGEEDHIKPAVEQLGTLSLWQIAMKPGKPFAYGWVAAQPAVVSAARPADGTPSPTLPRRAGEGNGAHFIGLPGNPVSSFVTFLLLVRPFLLKLQGATRTEVPAILLPAHFEWKRPDKRREFLRVRRNPEGGLELFPNQSSGVLTSTAWADGLVDNPAGQAIAHGDTVRFLPFAELLA